MKSELVPFKRKPRRVLDLDAEARRRAKEDILGLIGNDGIWPLDAPGMPPPGPDFLAAAAILGDDTVFKKSKKNPQYKPGQALADLYRRALREPGFRLNVAARGGTRDEGIFVPGHIWGQHVDSWVANMADHRVKAMPVDGPHPAEVMVIGKMPWKEEIKEGRNLVAATGETLTNIIKRLHIKGSRKWYITNLVKFCPPDDAPWTQKWVHDCLPLLAAELRIVRPKYILCLGADASKAILGDRFNVSYMEGRVVPHTYPVHLSHEDEPEQHTALVMTVVHPVMVTREPGIERTLERGMARFNLLINGARFDLEEKGLDHRVCDSLEEAEEWFAEANAELRNLPKKDKLIGWDAEWQGKHPQNEGSYLRLIQVSWAEKKSIAFKIRHAGGRQAFRDADGKPAFKRLAKLLNRFMIDKRAVMHFGVADLEWLHYHGIDPIKHCPIPLEDKDGKKPWQRLRDGEGWLDTAMMVHAIEETAMLGLESVTMRYSTAPRYDIPLEDWKKAYCKEREIKAEALEGYGDCPDEILVPYSVYDSDVTRRHGVTLQSYLDCDYEGNCAWESCWESMIIQKPILEIHQTGITVARERVDVLTENFVSARASQEETIRDWACWPEFNIRSVFQVREFLFGEKYNGKIIRPKKDKKTGRMIWPPKRIRPEDGISLGIQPLLDTSKPPRRWVDLVAKGLDKNASPTTGKQVLAILAQDNLQVADQINWIRDYRFLDTVLKSVLRPPTTDEDNNWIVNDDGFYEYEAGLAASIDADGRVRTHISPTAETGRWKHRRPNLANLCVDAATEFLTKRGWVHANELREDDQTAQYWPSSGKVDFVRPTALVVMDHQGHMIRLKTEKQIDLLLTPQHRCFLRRRKHGHWFETPAERFVADCHHVHAGFYVGGGLALSSSWVTWLCAVQADGSYVKGGGVVFTFSKKRKVQRLTQSLAALGAHYRCRSGKTPSQAKRVTRIYVGLRANRDFLAETKRLLGKDKCFGPWLLEYDRETLNMFAGEVCLWDGRYKTKTSFSSSNKTNADWVQALMTLSGVRARMHTSHQNKKARVHYHVHTPARRVDYSLTTNFTAEKTPWNDKVYCVTVPSEFIIVRRNGKVSVTGNSKSRDPDYVRLLGENYRWKVRSILKAAPKRVLIEFDYKGAELFMTAINANSRAMIEHCQRANKYPEEGYDRFGKETPGGLFPHPEYYDIHSNVAVMAFKLRVNDYVHKKLGNAAEFLGLPVGSPLPPTKIALEVIGRKHFRTLAKNVIFGLLYGRGAKAIALQAKEAGADVTVEEAQRVIDTVFEIYPELVAFFEAAKSRAREEKWLCNCFGRFRRFPVAADYKLEGEFERQAMNFPIQSGVASAVDRGLAMLLHMRDNVLKRPDLFRLLLQLHDAGVIEAPYYAVSYLVNDLIPYAMRDCVPIYPANLAGEPTGTGPYYLGLDISVEKHWSEKLTVKECRKFGIPTAFAAKA